MIILLVIFLILLAITLYLLFAPIVFELSYERMFMVFRFHKIASFTVNYENENWNLILKIFWWKRDIRELEGSSTIKKSEKEGVKEKKKSRRRISFTRIKNVIKSFRVRKCIVSIDTNDAVTNGLLFPFFYGLARWTGKNISINFKGEQRIELFITNNVARMLWAFIKPIKK